MWQRKKRDGRECYCLKEVYENKCKACMCMRGNDEMKYMEPWDPEVTDGVSSSACVSPDNLITIHSFQRENGHVESRLTLELYCTVASEQYCSVPGTEQYCSVPGTSLLPRGS